MIFFCRLYLLTTNITHTRTQLGDCEIWLIQNDVAAEDGQRRE